MHASPMRLALARRTIGIDQGRIVAIEGSVAV